jgi:hypothetical protein
MMKLKGGHFYTIEMIEAELKAVPNALTEQDFQDTIKKCQKHWEQCICAEGDYVKDDGG